ncbi:MAG: DegT/DnrJ/EryC1/StrS family aminotransferase [Methanomicrobiaceae archaeon]|nr:DegT/DnrJ/EryC1/StrS family aminotransferase [Methanomicrobiaceae archaeon]
MIPLMKNAFIREEDTKTALSEFIKDTDRLSMDAQCFEFERKFAQYQERKYAILFNSGSSANLALLQSLVSLNILKKGDTVGFSALTWATNVMPIIQMGLIPVPIDCDPKTLNVMSYTLEERLKSTELQALFITNALGFAGDLENIKQMCIENDVLLIEDNCESLGSVLKSRKAGNFGLASTFSFYVAHHLSTIEGGMVCTDDEDLDQMLRIVRAHGWDRNLSTSQQVSWRERHKIENEFFAKYSFYDLGYNLRPTEITGFLGLYQLQFLEEAITIRERNYLRIEKQMQQNDDLMPVDHSHLSRLSNFAIPIICKTPEKREQYKSKFEQADIEIRPMIAGNIQRQPFYGKYVYGAFDLPGADFIHNCGFYCGNYPEMTQEDLSIISDCLEK